MRLFILTVFVLHAFPIAAQASQTKFCMFFDKQCHLSRQIDSLEQWKDKPHYDYFEDTFSRVLDGGNEITKRKMLNFLNGLEDNKHISEYKLYLYASLGQLPDAINILRHLQELDAAYDPPALPQFSVIAILVQNGRALDALQFAKETQHIKFKGMGGQWFNYAREPRAESRRLLVEEFHKNDQPDKVCEVVQLLNEDGIFKTTNPEGFIEHIRSSYGIHCPISSKD